MSFPELGNTLTDILRQAGQLAKPHFIAALLLLLRTCCVTVSVTKRTAPFAVLFCVVL